MTGLGGDATPPKIPEAFIASTVAREGPAGAAWLTALPGRIRELCRRWGLAVDGPLLHGYVAVVLPVRRRNVPLMLKVSWIDRSSEHEILALRAWAGRGAVRLVDADEVAGAMLLERLEAEHSLARAPLAEAVPVAGGLLRRLAIPAPGGLRRVSDELEEIRGGLEARWQAVGRPFSRALLERAGDVPSPRGDAAPLLLVNQDLHYGNVLRGDREPWLVIDPKPLAGDPEFGVAPLLWNRLDRSTAAADVRGRLEALVDTAGLDPERAHRWSLLRVVDYWLWALEEGFTEDPERCRWLVGALGGSAGPRAPQGRGAGGGRIAADIDDGHRGGGCPGERGDLA